jgi:predicted lysophospholipase L1 biosynthesis ABC-type transport system permease subunit
LKSIKKAARKQLFIRTISMPYFFLGLAAGFLAGAFAGMASSYVILLES